MAEELALGDSAVEAPVSLTKEILEKQQQIAKETISQIENSVRLTEEDKKTIEENKKKPGRPAKNPTSQAVSTSSTITSSSNDGLVFDLQAELNKFIQDKVDIENNSGVIEKLPSGILLLDTILGGGFGVGTVSLIVGNPGLFKSALLGQVIGASQVKYNGKLLSTFHDSESAMTTVRLSNLGVNNPKLRPYDNVTVESVFKTIEAICAFKQLKNIGDYPSIVAWDSVANTTTEKEMTAVNTNINETIGLKARLLAALFPRYLSKMKENKISLIAVNQLREKLAMGPYAAAADLRWMGDKEMPGGQSLKYNAFHLLLLKHAGDIKMETYGFTGIKLEVKCIKNRFFAPNIPIDLVVDFNKGISNFWSNYNFLVDNKKIQAGAWNFLLSLPEVKFRTVDAMEKYNTNEKGFKDMFDKEVNDTIKSEILDKYSVQ